LDEKRAELTKAVDEKNKELQQLQKDLAKAHEEVREVIKERYERENWVFERPDATIVSVNAKEGTVNIDVGRRNFLRLNVQFAVFQRGETNVHNRKKKATVSVTRLIGENLAEARIVESDLKDPILQGDVVFTPTWTPGMQERFVLAGDFDVNGDRKPDNDLVRALVDMNGGVVEQDVAITTRYLLLGDAPPASDKVADDHFKKVKTRAKELSIKVMGLQEFLEYSGAHETLRQLQNLDVRSKEDTKPILKDGKRQFSSGASQKIEPEGGTRRLEPGNQSRIEAAASGGNEGARKFKERRPQP
jgi:hypothetical protein